MSDFLQSMAALSAERAAAAAKVAAANREIAPGVRRPKFRVGDTKQAVIAELGNPRGSTMRGKTETLLYKHFEIRIEGGKVSAIQLLKSK